MYIIRKFTEDINDEDNQKIILEVETEEEAKEYCQREDTKGEGWFCGYSEE